MTRNRPRARRAPALVGLLLAAGAAGAGERPPFELRFPLDCQLGKGCWVTNYLDLAPGPAGRDYRCGHRATDGHGGTDIGVATLPAARRHRVRAVAAGRVVGIRNGMPDINVLEREQGAIGGKDCGNGVRIDHGGGWVTQYCHMRQGSIAVEAGARVSAGTFLGAVGLSGRTEHPHLHLSLTHNGEDVDPFSGVRPGKGACQQPGQPLWSAITQRGYRYRSRVIYNAGFAPVRPQKVPARAGDYARPTWTARAGALVLWADVIGPRQGDVLEFTIRGPGGQQRLQHRHRFKQDHAQWFGFAGLRPDGAGFQPGAYRGRLRLKGGDGEAERKVDVRLK